MNYAFWYAHIDFAPEDLFETNRLLEYVVQPYDVDDYPYVFRIKK